MLHRSTPFTRIFLAVLFVALVGPLQARTVVVRAEPTIDVAASLLPAIRSAVEGTPDVEVVAGASFDAGRAEATPPDAQLVAFVSKVSFNRRPAIRVVVVDVARGLRLDVDETSIAETEAAVPEVVANSIVRALAKAAERVELVCVAAPVAYPEVKPTADTQGQPVPFVPEPTADDAILSTLLATTGVAVVEFEYRTLACPVPGIDAEPLLPTTAPRWLFDANIKRAANAIETSLTPAVMTLTGHAPDGRETTTTVPLPSNDDLRRPVAAAMRDLARQIAGGEAHGGPATRPISDRVADLADRTQQPEVAVALAEFAVAEAPGDLPARRNVAAAYTTAVTAKRAGETFQINPALPPEQSPAVIDFERRAALHDRGLAHARAVFALGDRAISPATTGDVDPLVALCEADPVEWPFAGNGQELLAEKREARQRALQTLFAAWAAESIAAGRVGDGRFAALAIDRLPVEQRIEATRHYFATHLDTPGLIERVMTIGGNPSGVHSINGKVVGSRAAAMAMLRNTTAPARWRQAQRAAMERAIEIPRMPVRPPSFASGLYTPTQARTRPRQASQQATDEPAEIAWSPIAGFPYETCPVRSDGRRFGWRANEVVEFDAEGNPTTLYKATGPSGEAGHVFDLSYDGKHLYAAIFRPWLPDGAPPLLVLDTSGGEPTFLGAEDGVPAADADRLSLAAIAPGRLFVAGAKDVAWHGLLTYEAGKLTFDRFSETRPLQLGRSLEDPLVWPPASPIRRATTAEADDVANAYIPSGVRLAGRDDSGSPTHAIVFRDYSSQNRPLLISLADRSTQAFADPVSSRSVFMYNDELYVFKPASRPNAARTTTPTASRPTNADGQIRSPTPVRPMSIARLDRLAGRLETTFENAILSEMFIPVPSNAHAANGRLYVLADYRLFVSDGPDRPFRPLLPPFEPNRGSPAIARIETVSERAITIWSGTRKLRGTFLRSPTTQPAP